MLALAFAVFGAARAARAASFGRGIWLSQAEIQALPTSGAAWKAVKEAADGPWGVPTLSDPSSNADVNALAGALVYQRTGDERYRTRVVNALKAIVGTETSSSAGSDAVLAVGRNLVSYVIAADLVGFSDPGWRSWLAALRTKQLQSGRGETLVGCHELRPNNWGTNCGAARIAADAFLGDIGDLGRAAQVFRGWLGDRSQYTGFNFHELWWQADPANPVGIAAKGATIQGRNVDGVLPDDQRRSGPFTWPPPQEDYVWGALGPAFVQAELLYRAGYTSAYGWSDAALRRAITWLYTVDDFPASGDNTWVPWLANFAYGTSFAAFPKTRGKSMAWTDWTHARRRGTSSTATPTSGSPPSSGAPASTSQTERTVLTPTADAQVKSTKPNVNFGGLATLQVRSGADGNASLHAYLTFSVAGRAGPIRAATLRLYVTDPSRSGGAVFAAAPGWSEASLTWGNAPGPSGRSLGTLNASTTGAYTELDVSSAIQGNGTYSFVIVGSATNSAVYSSRQGAHPPQLVIE